MADNIHSLAPNPDRSAPSSAGGGDGRDIGERVARLEAHVQHLATQADMESLKTAMESIKVEIEKIRTGFWKSLFAVAGTAAVVAASVAGIVIKIFD